MKKCAVLLDIEGTVCPIQFVSGQLFPWVLANIDKWLEVHWGDPEVRKIAARFHEAAPELPDGREALAAHIRTLMDADRKVTPLKELQGLMWHEAYERRELKSPLYPDVRPALERWCAGGLSVAIYSSGSELAQRDFFSHTESGDLTPFIAAYFDTRIGAKREPQTYRAIAKALGLTPSQVLFISDVRAELDAASMTSMGAVLAVRPGNPTQDSGNLRRIGSFEEIEINSGDTADSRISIKAR